MIGINIPYHITITSTQVLTYHEIIETELWSKIYGCEYDKNVSHGIFMASRDLTKLQNLYASDQTIDVEGSCSFEALHKRLKVCQNALYRVRAVRHLFMEYFVFQTRKDRN